MSLIRSALTVARKRRISEDDGFSLMETIVAMVIFSIFMSTAMAAIISIMNSTHKSQSLTDGAAQLENAFQRLDHQVRYADAVNQPGPGTNGTYVEWHTQATSTTPQTCAQLKYDPTAKTLSERTWLPGAAVVAATSWILVANNIVNTASQPPFAQIATKKVGGTTTLLAHQQLVLDLFSRPGGQIKKVTNQSEITTSFTALNSTTQSGLVCQEVARS
jgi:prepilin-type N-terminal cleavage/methylation domain-containing protein